MIECGVECLFGAQLECGVECLFGAQLECGVECLFGAQLECLEAEIIALNHKFPQGPSVQQSTHPDQPICLLPPSSRKKVMIGFTQADDPGA